jgi:alpha-galactosidase
VIAGFSLTGTTEGAEKKVRVYILAGQSNMQEKARLKPLASQVGMEKYRDRYTHLIKDGDHAAFTKRFEASNAKDPKNPEYLFSERTDVWISNHDIHANLSADYSKNGYLGLEVNFGHAMGDEYDEQVLIIKTAWGGKSIDVGFRPPSAMPSEDELKAKWEAYVANKRRMDGIRLENYKKKLAEFEAGKAAGKTKAKAPKNKKPKPAKTFEEFKGKFGESYRNMITEVKAALANLKTNHPAYQDQGYEIKGFVWFQGYNDKGKEVARNNYAKNLVTLIKDVKKELNAPNMQTVIGQMGHDGDLKGKYPEKKDKETGKMVMDGQGAIRKAQLEASENPDIKNSTALVRTAPLWDMECDAIYKGPGGWSKNIDKWNQFGSDKTYHYYGSPWFFSQAGTAFAKAMIGLHSK